MADIIAFALENEFKEYLEKTVNYQLDTTPKNFFDMAMAQDDEILEINGENAVLEISGIMTRVTPNPIIKYLFGGVGYDEIIEACDKIKAANVKNLTILFDSPGGHAMGCQQTFDKFMSLRDAGIKITAINTGVMASAAYYLAAAANKIYSSSPENLTGSIGTIIATYSFRGAMETAGIKEIIIRSKNAGNKSWPLDTPKGLELAQKQVDAYERFFISAISKGRGMSEEDVIKNFGNGAMFVAKDPDNTETDAVKIGMIDGIINSESEIMYEGDSLIENSTSKFQDYPLKDITWDSQSAEKRWREFTNSTDKPSTSYKNGFFWYDESNPEKFASYKLPFVDIVGKTTYAIINGVNASNAAMAGARGGVQIPQKDRAAVQAHIDRYRKKIQAQKSGKKSNNSDLSALNDQEETMSLKQILEENPGVKAEFDAAIAAAKNEGAEKINSEISARVAAANPILASAEYPKRIKDMAADVISGKVDISALHATTAAYDSIIEKQKSDESKNETEEIGATGSGAQKQNKTMDNEADETMAFLGKTPEVK